MTSAFGTPDNRKRPDRTGKTPLEPHQSDRTRNAPVEPHQSDRSGKTPLEPHQSDRTDETPLEPVRTLRAGTRLTHEIEVRRSRFITTLARTDDEAQARALVAQVRASHPQARHHCTAWVIASDGATPLLHSNDDGEPAGTAGTPMLEVLRSSGLLNVSAVVTRYFGGILLGTGGLVRAYSSAVAKALALAPRAHLDTLEVLETTLGPADAGRVEAELRGEGALVLAMDWAQDVTLRVAVSRGDIDALSQSLARVTSGASRFRHQGSHTVEVDDPATPE